MITISKTINDPFIINYFQNFKNDCFLDIETTGLNKITDTIIIIGLLYKNNHKINLTQWIAEDLHDEKDLLINFLNILDINWRFYTYNGLMFDFPFIKKKCDLYRFDFNIEALEHFDLFQYIKGHKLVLPFSNLKLKTLINYYTDFNIEDNDGKSCILNYHNYLKTRDSKLLKKIYKYNQLDLTGLNYSTQILADLNNLLIFEFNSIQFNICSYQFNKNFLTITGSCSSYENRIHSLEIFKNYYSLSISKDIFLLKLDIKQVSINNYIFNITDSIALNIPSLSNNIDILPSNIIPLSLSLKNKSNINKIFINNIKLIFKKILEQYK